MSEPLVTAERDARSDALSSKRARGNRLRFTTEGTLFLLMTLGIGFAAVNTGNNLLYLVLGLMLSLIILSGALSDLVLLGIHARRRLPSRAVAGTQAIIEIELKNEKRFLPSFSLSAVDEIESVPNEKGTRGAYFLKINAQGEHLGRYVIPLQKRGLLRLVRIRVSTRYPFGFFEKSRRSEQVEELVVLPRIVPVPDLQDAIERLLGNDPQPAPSHQQPRSDGVDIAGLRPYRVGDEARSIHWRRSASLGTTVVRELDPNPGRDVALRIDNAFDASDPVASEAFERIVSRAASMALVLHDRGLGVEVLARGLRSAHINASQPLDPLLNFLALIGPASREMTEPHPPARAHAVLLDVDSGSADA